MKLLTELFGSRSRASTAKMEGACPPSPVTTASWPAPKRKASTLVLKKPSAGSLPAYPSGTPFAPPVQGSAFDVPRPTAIQPTSSPWAVPAPRADALILRRLNSIRSENEFTRPPFQVKRPAALPAGEVCRSC